MRICLPIALTAPMRLGLMLLTIMALAAPPAAAQSFDCARAAHPDETAICGDRALADLDVRMATLWWVTEQVPMMMGARGAARDAQAAFLKTRAACGAGRACIETAYRKRIATLEQALKGQMQDYCKAIQLC